MRLGRALLLFLSGVWASYCQQWMLGVGAGYGTYRDVRVFAPAGVIKAGIQDRYTLHAWLGERATPVVSGELRYTYQDGDPVLRADGRRIDIQGQSHAICYVVLLHPSRPGSSSMLYVALGLGAKLYRVTGPEPLNPLWTDKASLRSRNQYLPVALGGVGLESRLGRHNLVRVELSDFITPFPKRVIEPAPHATPRGLFQQITVSFGIGWVL